MKDRIKQLMEAQHMTQQTFAQVLGINPATLSQIFSGKANPSLNHVEAIRRGFPNISYAWLLGGEGPMFNMVPVNTVNNITSAANAKAELPLFANEDQPTPTPQKNTTQTESKKQTAIYEPVPSKFNLTKKDDTQERKVKEIVIYYTNNTFETFVPKH